jgi:hypothetical protein
MNAKFHVSSYATFFITTVCSNSESQVVAYLKEKEAKRDGCKYFQTGG